MLIALAFALFDTLVKSISWVSVTLVAIAMAPWLVRYVSGFELPGGVKVSLREATQLQQEAAALGAESPAPETNELLEVLTENPDLALAGLRIEIERKLLEIARLYGKEVSERSVSITMLTRRLRDANVLQSPQVDVLLDLIPVLNDAVHARQIQSQVRNLVMNAAAPLLAYLDRRISELRPIAALRNE